MSVKFGRSHWGRNVGWRCLRIGCWGEYVCGPIKDEVKGEGRKLYSEELNDLHFPKHIIRVIKSRRMRLAGHVVGIGERRGVYRALVRKPKGRRPRRRFEDNIKMNLNSGALTLTLLQWKSNNYYVSECFCSLIYAACIAHAPYYIVTRGQYGSSIFFHIFSYTPRFSRETVIK